MAISRIGEILVATTVIILIFFANFPLGLAKLQNTW